MSDYTEFYLAAPSAVALLEMIEISHPDFSQSYYIVRNRVRGVQVTLETSESRFYTYYPIKVEPMGFKDDLDQGFTMTIGDTGDILPDEIDRVFEADGFDVKPTFVYRAYRSDNLLVPLYGPINLEIAKVTMADEGATFEAKAPALNEGRTGEMYRIDRFPMLRGLL
jgi:hypothetical protein